MSEKNENKNQNTISNNDKNLAALSYVWCISLLVFFQKNKTPFIRFHAAQAFTLFILSIVCWFIPFINQPLLFFIGVLMIIGFLNAVAGKYYEIPVIAHLAFAKNPFRNAAEKIGKTGIFIGYSIKNLFHSSTELKKKLEQTKADLLAHEAPKITDFSDTQRNNDLAAFSYLWILSIFIMSQEQKSEFVLFHGRQALTLFFLSLLVAPFGLIGFYLFVLLLLCSIVGFFFAYKGEYYRIPLISFIAENNKTSEILTLHIKSCIRYIKYIFCRVFKTQEKQSWMDIKKTVQQEWETIKPAQSQDFEESHDIAAASYIFLGPLFLFLHKRNPFIQFHSKQATLLIIFWVLLFAFEETRWLSFIPLSGMILGYSKSMASIYYPIPIIYDLLQIRISQQEVKEQSTNIARSLVKTTKRLFISQKEIKADSGSSNSQPKE